MNIIIQRRIHNLGSLALVKRDNKIAPYIVVGVDNNQKILLESGFRSATDLSSGTTLFTDLVYKIRVMLKNNH
tara:strand:- start:931 stop:1149 length:219 start_codon:yes stop_codon:yes gene_type:complete